MSACIAADSLARSRPPFSKASALAFFTGCLLPFCGPAAAQDPPAAFGKCLACHAVGAGAPNKTGPVLNGVAGKAVGSAEGFAYSDALSAAKAQGLVWSDASLDTYLTNPAAMIPGTRMAWAVADAGERAAIIAYLKTLP